MPELSTERKGDAAEYKVIAYLKTKGYSVSKPCGDNDRYDIILDDSGDLYRVQIKTANYKGDYSILKCRSSHYNSGGYTKDEGYSGEIDLFAFYCFELDEIYWVECDNAPNTNMHIRYESEKEDERINWADEYTERFK